jgi:hypothetical protein
MSRIFYILDLGRVAARVDSDDHGISWPEDLCKSSQKFGSLVTSEVTNTGTEVNNALRAACERGMLEPLFTIVVCAKKSMARDVFEFRDLGQRTLKFLER